MDLDLNPWLLWVSFRGSFPFFPGSFFSGNHFSKHPRGDSWFSWLLKKPMVETSGESIPGSMGNHHGTPSGRRLRQILLSKSGCQVSLQRDSTQPSWGLLWAHPSCFGLWRVCVCVASTPKSGEETWMSNPAAPNYCFLVAVLGILDMRKGSCWGILDVL